MAKLSAHGREIGRYIGKGGFLFAAHEDGVTLCRSGIYGGGWKVYSRKKAEVPLSEWTAKRQAYIDGLPKWRKPRTIPSMAKIESWVNDGYCMTPSGEKVEPDGYGSDGSPSWALLLGLI